MGFNDAYSFLRETVFYHEDLHNEFWTDGEFDDGIRDKLLAITRDFVDDTVDVKDIDDIQLTGSMANYNYTEYSDLDVHVLADFSKIDPNADLVKAALDGKRFIWNLRHDIMIRGHEVEMYFQDTHEPHIASGLFSLKNNKWIKVPVYDPPQIDDRDVDKKANGISDMIQRLKEEIDSDLSPEDAKLYHRKAKRLKEKIGNMRRAGLRSSGEFSVENLAFKKLRNGGDIGDLIESISKAYSKIYSEQTDTAAFTPVKESTFGFEDLFKTVNKINKTETDDKSDSEAINGLLGIDKKKGPRQQKWGTGVHRLHQNLLPDMHKVDPTLNHKIETLREKPGRMVCTPMDVKHIMDVYNMADLNDIKVKERHTEDNPKSIGTTKIQLYNDGNNWWMKHATI